MDSFNRINKYNILLASASIRRQELLKQLGIKFTIVSPSSEEEIIPENAYREGIAERIAMAKADSFTDLKDNDLLITADTIVWIDDKVLGKPADYADAFQMLKLLSGKEHFVFTGVCLKTSSMIKVFSSETLVKFSELSDEEIRYYIENYKPYDKAGAYGIQEWIGKVAVERIEGSFYNVMGLPVQRLYQELKKMCLEIKN
ncbi:MAG: Maf family nucleotide pyrophosphatase [Bacteroidales bacterium]|jgi:septum formation protein|nr:Maf family nucleotide pyrophosphatase [Bacteroidales bacterium]